MSAPRRKPFGRGAGGAGRGAADAGGEDAAAKPVQEYHHIGNRIKRQQIYHEGKADKRKAKKQAQLKRKRDSELLGEDAPPKKAPKTLENTREEDETVVDPEDEEVKADEQFDEFASYFNREIPPKIIITTSYDPSKYLYEFIKELLVVFPNSFFYHRKQFPIKTIVDQASAKGFTDLIVINEDRKFKSKYDGFNGLTHIHLPDGPTAYYKLSSVQLSKHIEGHGLPTNHKPEVIVNNFNTRLGHRVGRMLSSLFHQEPNFRGRRVITFHNQRDFIFVRHHRYIFDNKEKSRIQELGPRFTLKLRWLQKGTFDTQTGELEWIHKREMDSSRRRFFL